MREHEIMRILAQEVEQDVSFGAPVHQDRVFIIMWESSKSGGTYTELRKSIRGKDKFLRGLHFFGVDLNEVRVIDVPKAWVPEPKKSKPKYTH